MMRLELDCELTSKNVPSQKLNKPKKAPLLDICMRNAAVCYEDNNTFHTQMKSK
uniref:Uncharacterized protein n=1 Tax=Arundo donax TaxID=35708 RepID=A0A0A8ZEL5_ARUDO